VAEELQSLIMKANTHRLSALD